ncbi:MAG: alpha-E domain-containing protein [Alphaproteobacteria bacterium]|nr:alpha-E domain-containing protein [Alphaproteobacteria bacterium]
MLSRVAESLFWMARYIERAENVSRFIAVNMHLTLDLASDAIQQWDPLIATTGDQTIFYHKYGKSTQDNAIQFLIFDEDNANSIKSCLIKARENARGVRDVLTTEIWEQINHLYLSITSETAPLEAAQNVFQYCKKLRLETQLVKGLVDNTISRTEAWHYLYLGRMLERAEKTVRILDVKYYILLPKVEHVGTPIDNIQWAAVLMSASALDMYHRQYRRFLPSSVAHFLLFNRDFPRSVLYCLTKSESSLCAISNTPIGTYSNEAERQLGRLRAQLEYADINDIIQNGLHEFIRDLISNLNEIGNTIQDHFFSSQSLPTSSLKEIYA